MAVCRPPGEVIRVGLLPPAQVPQPIACPQEILFQELSDLGSWDFLMGEEA
jgi:hypothetical protein